MRISRRGVASDDYAGDSITAVAAGERRASRVQVRYRRASGEFVDTTLDRVQVDEVAGGLPVREFRWYKGRRHYSGWYWSATVGRLVVYESRLELARIMLADQDREVASIAAQPFQLTGPDQEGRRRRHVPDLLLVGRDGGVTVVDVKPASKLADKAVAEVFAWTDELVACRGWGFEVWSGADRHVLDNVRFLAGYRRASTISTELIATVLEVAADQCSIRSVERVLSGQYPSLVVRPVVLHLLWSGLLWADLTCPLSADTLLKRGEVRSR